MHYALLNPQSEITKVLTQNIEGEKCRKSEKCEKDNLVSKFHIFSRLSSLSLILPPLTAHCLLLTNLTIPDPTYESRDPVHPPPLPRGLQQQSGGHV